MENSIDLSKQRDDELVGEENLRIEETLLARKYKKGGNGNSLFSFHKSLLIELLCQKLGLLKIPLFGQDRVSNIKGMDETGNDLIPDLLSIMTVGESIQNILVFLMQRHVCIKYGLY